jgi:hypothetical protein
MKPYKLFCIAIFLLVFNAFAEPPDNTNFPEWYSKNLVALQEPSLFELSKDKKAHVYRFLWLRTFDKPIALRLVVYPEGTGLIFKKISDGSAGYDPGELVVNETVAVNKEDVDTFLEMLNKVKFWQLPIKEKSDVLGLDGAQWVIEGVSSGKYHLVDRWSPTKGQFREAALQLVRLAGIKVKAVY